MSIPPPGLEVLRRQAEKMLDVRRTRDLRRQEVEGTYRDAVEDIRELFPEEIEEIFGWKRSSGSLG